MFGGGILLHLLIGCILARFVYLKCLKENVDPVLTVIYTVIGFLCGIFTVIGLVIARIVTGRW